MVSVRETTCKGQGQSLGTTTATLFPGRSRGKSRPPPAHGLTSPETPQLAQPSRCRHCPHLAEHPRWTPAARGPQGAGSTRFGGWETPEV